MTAAALDFNVSAELRQEMRQWRQRALIAGIAGTLLCAIGFFVDHDQFYRSYLWSYVYVVGVSLGSMAWLMLQYLTGGAWGVVIRRPAEAGARTMPLIALMFLPVLIGINNLYPWVHPVAGDEVIRHKQIYLNVPFFIARAVLYLAGWNVIGYLLNLWSKREDSEGGTRPHDRLAVISAPGILFWAFSITFMSIDWVMSADPHWFSTIFGMLFMAGQGLSSLAFLITLLVLLSYRRPMSDVLTARHLHDLGKLLLALVMVWAYFSFSQFLIIWSGNLPDDITWYLERLRGGWQYIGLILVLCHFALPFALLLSRDLKRNFKLLASICVFILVIRMIDVFWLVAPDFRKGHFGVSWLDFAAPLGVVGLWLAYFLTQLEKRPLMPINEPHLMEALEHGRE
jgi:hypothetical protein